MGYYFSVGAIFKNEAMVIKEWIEHNKLHGVDHLYLVDDFSTDNYLEIVQPYIDSGYVTLHKNNYGEKVTGRQVTIGEIYFKPIVKDSKWFAIFDIDEFIYSPNHVDVKEVLKQNEEHAQILVNWVWFGSNGHDKQPRSVVEGFTKRLAYNSTVYGPGRDGWDHHATNATKTIINTERLGSFGIHSHNVNGSTVNLSYQTDEHNPQLLLNHYIVQSKEYWEKVKMVRGDVNCWHRDDARNWDYFNALDKGDIEDVRLLEQNKTIIY